MPGARGGNATGTFGTAPGAKAGDATGTVFLIVAKYGAGNVTRAVFWVAPGAKAGDATEV